MTEIPIVYFDHRGSRDGLYLFGRPGSDETLTVDELPAGAAWFDPFKGARVLHGPDGKRLYVKTPGGPWLVDGRANNCTRPDDLTHHCWVRHGSPEDGTLHVDKDGDTCACGASIGQGPNYTDYHGHLHHGKLVSC